MAETVRCECGNEVRSAGVHPVSLRCPLCGRRPPIGVAVVSGQIGTFAALLILLSLLTAVPGIWAMIDALAQMNEDPARTVPVWAYLSIFAALVQIGYSVYLLQFPHWASLQAVAIVSLVWGVLAAIAFGGTLVGSSAGWAGTVLQLGDMLPATKGPKISGAAMWCFLMTVSWTGYSIWCGWRAQAAGAQVRHVTAPHRSA